MKQLIFVLFIAAGFGTRAQPASPLVCGPMLCHISHREATIWLEVSPDVNSVEVKCWKKNEPASARIFTQTGLLHQDYNPVKVILTNLDMATEYEYEIDLDHKRQSFNFPLTFKTKQVWEYRMPPPEFSFIFGSCAYINDPPYDRPGKPYGRDPRIFDSIANNPSDFMIWNGDNMYTREADFTSKTGFYYRYTHDRSIPEMKKLLASRPNYAVWDDHDYGPNDAGASFELKAISLQAFKDFWGNPGYGEPDHSGVYTHFAWSDCDFFLTDDRYYRSDEKLDSLSADKHFFGREQLSWLENNLLDSKASFKFIVIGSQTLNPLNRFECLRHYRQEYDELIGFIVKYKITGVIFLTGDRHYSDIIRITPEGGYPLYDITSSAFTSGSYPETKQTPEGTNPYRVVPDMVFDQNYIRIAITVSKSGERMANITCYTVDGKVPWTYTIRQQDLK